DLARSEPAGRVDSVLLDQVLAYGVGLLLGQDLGKVDVVVIVGEGGDDDLRLWLAGLLAPAPDLVEVGAADGGQNGAPRFEQFLITDQLAEGTLALADRAGNGVDLFEPRLGGPGQVVELLERGTGPLHQVAELDRRLRLNRTSLGDQGRVRPAGRDLDDARA